MDLNYSTEEEEEEENIGTGRSYECIFCKRGFTTAQALGGHMNIHRKQRANKTKPGFPPPSSSSKVDGSNNNYADLGFYSEIPSHCSTAPAEVDANSYREQVYFPATAPSIIGEVLDLCVENQPGHVFAQDWRKRNSMSLYTNPLCFHQIKDKFEEDGLDLELRLGHQHP